MTDEDAFLARIRATPDDDLPRIVFADWLDEHGEADRAEFIRVQCQLANWKTLPDGTCPACKAPVGDMHADDCPRFLLRRRGEELSGSYEIDRAFAAGWWDRPERCKWLPVERPIRLGEYDTHRDLLAIVSRGFVEQFVAPASAWLAHGDAIARRHPVRTVRLTDMPGEGYDVGVGGQLRGWVLGREWWADRTTGELTTFPDRENMVRRALDARWPGIRFELPPIRITGITDWQIGLVESEGTHGDEFVMPEGVQDVTVTISPYYDPILYAPQPRQTGPGRTTRRDSIPSGWQPRFPRPR